jgi:hypothetical protein
LDALSNKRIMKKLFIILVLLISSCGARKVAIVKEDTKITTDSVAVVKIDGTYTKDNNVFINTTTEEVEICPIVDSLPITVNGVQYKNVRIKTKKINRTVIDTSKVKASKNVLKTVSKAKSESSSISKKAIDKKESLVTNTFVWLMALLLFIVGGALIRKAYKTYI